MSTHARIILKSALGALCAAISGAALLGLPTYFSTESTFLGPASWWAWFAAIAGFFWGIVPGAFIGFLVTKFQTSKFMGAIIGAGVGLSLVILFFVFGNDPRSDKEMFNTALACIPIGGVIGLIVSATNKRNAQNR